MPEPNLKKIVRELTPPFIYSMLAQIKAFTKKRPRAEWQAVRNGLLQGRQLFLSTAKGGWQESIIEGTYDQFIFDYIKQVGIEGTVIADIGSHIGYHALSFAQSVGEKGCVYAFEPNVHNMAYLQLNLEKNQDLAARIRLFDIAVSDKTGEETFLFSDEVEGGNSSGSFIKSADTYYPKTDDFMNSFKKMTVKTFSIDDLFAAGTLPIPRLLKIDVEGAESSVLQGAFRLLKDHKPLLLIEIHSIYNMLKTSDILHALAYEITLLKEEVDGRCFIAGAPKSRTIS